MKSAKAKTSRKRPSKKLVLEWELLSDDEAFSLTVKQKSDLKKAFSGFVLAATGVRPSIRETKMRAPPPKRPR